MLTFTRKEGESIDVVLPSGHAICIAVFHISKRKGVELAVSAPVDVAVYCSELSHYLDGSHRGVNDPHSLN